MTDSTSDSATHDSSGHLASSEALQHLDERHEELLVKLEALYSELETALANLLPKANPRPLQDAA